MDFKRYLLLLLHHFAIDRANNRSFLISSQLNRSEVPTFFPRVGHSKIKVPTFPPPQEQKVPIKSPYSPTSARGPPPRGSRWQVHYLLTHWSIDPSIAYSTRRLRGIFLQKNNSKIVTIVRVSRLFSEIYRIPWGTFSGFKELFRFSTHSPPYCTHLLMRTMWWAQPLTNLWFIWCSTLIWCEDFDLMWRFEFGVSDLNSV